MQLQKQIDNQQNLKKKLHKRRKGVVFIKNLPHGFFEEQLKKYFEQFGKVTRVRLARSRRTGNSKGFAYVEFAVPEVGKIAAETMDNYLMFQKIVKAAYIPPEEQKYNYFKTNVRKVLNSAGKEIFVSRKKQHVIDEMKAHNNWDDENFKKRTLSSLTKIEKLKKKYAHTNIDFDKLILGLNFANDNDETKDNKIVNKNDSVSTKTDDSHSESESEDITNKTDEDIKEHISEESSSEEETEEPTENILLIKKRKKLNKNSKSIIKKGKHGKNIGNKLNKNSTKVKQNKILKIEEKENIKKPIDQSLSTKTSKIENNSKINLIKVKNQDNNEISNKTASTTKKEKSNLKGIQKAKYKQLKSKSGKNKFNEILKNKLMEETLKEMMINGSKNETKKFTKCPGKKVKK